MASPGSSRSISFSIVPSTNTTGSIIQTARGVDSFPTRSSSEAEAMAPSPSSCRTASSLTSNTTSSCPARIRRRVMFAPIRPSPIIPSCIARSFRSTPSSEENLRRLQRVGLGRHVGQQRRPRVLERRRALGLEIGRQQREVKEIHCEKRGNRGGNAAVKVKTAKKHWDDEEEIKIR